MPPAGQPMGIPNSRPANRGEPGGMGRPFPDAPGPGVGGMPAGAPATGNVIKQTEFTVQFLWQETPESERKPTDPAEPVPAPPG